MAGSKRIAVLTSGGDCAGLNAVIRAVVLRASNTYGWQVIGVKQGTLGLLSRPPDHVELSPTDFTGPVLRMGGTILETATRRLVDVDGDLVETARGLGVCFGDE